MYSLSLLAIITKIEKSKTSANFLSLVVTYLTFHIVENRQPLRVYTLVQIHKDNHTRNKNILVIPQLNLGKHKKTLSVTQIGFSLKHTQSILF